MQQFLQQSVVYLVQISHIVENPRCIQVDYEDENHLHLCQCEDFFATCTLQVLTFFSFDRMSYIVKPECFQFRFS